MPAPIKVHFAIAGSKELDAAFKSVMDRVKQLNQLEQQAANTQDRAAQKSAKAIQAAADKAEKAAKKSAEAREKAAAKAAEKEKKEAESAENAKQKAAEKTEKYLARVRQNSMKAEQALRDKEIQGAKKAADAKIKEAERAAKAAERETMRAAQKANETARQRGSMAAGVFGRAVGGTLSTVSNIAAGMGATVGTYAIGQALYSNMALETRAALLENSTRDEKGNVTMPKAQTMALANAKAKEFGVGANEVVAAFETVAAKAGGAEGVTAFKQSIDDVMKTSIAFGVSMEDMGSVAAAALKAGIKPGEELNRLFTDLAAMGKKGNVEIKDLAKELPALKGIANTLDMPMGQGLRSVVGLAQIGILSGKSPEEATDMVKDLKRDLGAKAKNFGVTPYTATGQRSLAETASEMIDAAFTTGAIGGVRDTKTGKMKHKRLFGIEALYAQEIGLTGQSQMIMGELVKQYQQGYKGFTGKNAVDRYIKDTEGSLASGERDKSFATVMETSEKKMAKARAAFEEEISKLLPEFQKLMPVLTDLSIKFAQLAVWVGKNPFDGLAVLFTTKLTSEILSANLGEALRNSFTNQLSGAQPLSPLANLAALTSIALTAYTVYLAGTKIIDDAAERGEKAGGTIRNAEINAISARGALRRGAISPEQAKKILEDERAKLGVAEKSVGGETPEVFKSHPYIDALLSTLPPSVGAAITGARTAGMAGYGVLKGFEGQGMRAEAAGGSFDTAKKALDDLAAALRNATEAANGMNDLSNPNNGARGGRPPGLGGPQ